MILKTNNKFDAFLCRIFKAMGYFAGGVGALMMILSVANVIMRGIFGAPIYGTVELVGYGGLLMGAFAIAHNELTDGNIMMTLFTDKMRPMQQAYSLGVTSFICIIFYGAIAYRYWAEIFTSLANKGASATLGIPYYLVNIVMFIGFGMAALAFVVKFIRHVMFISASRKRKDPGNSAGKGDSSGESCMGGI
jgi:TRAP-type C4-dicarboxylate transport system permease small subunit